MLVDCVELWSRHFIHLSTVLVIFCGICTCTPLTTRSAGGPRPDRAPTSRGESFLSFSWSDNAPHYASFWEVDQSSSGALPSRLRRSPYYRSVLLRTSSYSPPTQVFLSCYYFQMRRPYTRSVTATVIQILNPWWFPTQEIPSIPVRLPHPPLCSKCPITSPLSRNDSPHPLPAPSFRAFAHLLPKSNFCRDVVSSQRSTADALGIPFWVSHYVPPVLPTKLLLLHRITGIYTLGRGFFSRKNARFFMIVTSSSPMARHSTSMASRSAASWGSSDRLARIF